MGLMRQLKGRKPMADAAPDQTWSAQQMQQLIGRQQASATGGGRDYEPIAGVSIEIYAGVAKDLAAYNYDPSAAIELAVANGISAANWEQATVGWNERIRTNRMVAQRFNELCAR
jgi:hypothetical protein